MDPKYHSQLGGGGGRGTVGSKKLGASSYLMELVPGVDKSGRDNVHRLHRSQVDMLGAHLHPPVEDGQGGVNVGHHDSIAAAMYWMGHDHRDHTPSSSTTSIIPRGKLSRSKKSNHVPTSHRPPLSNSDSLIIIDSPVTPGVPLLYRTPEARAANPDRLNLNNRYLTVIPIIEGEERLRLLNLQHNAIIELQNLETLRRLVFLDLYSNLIHEMSGLDNLVSLRVLMLGRNRIRKICDLQNLVRLDVLDLHGNMITEIEGLSTLFHLRILNLAGNDITSVSGVVQLNALEELNLRRNRVTTVYQVDELGKLMRLFLSHNRIQSFEDISSVCRCVHLKELTLDGNSLSHSTNYRQSIILHVKHLTSLDQKLVTDLDHREALQIAHAEEERRKERDKLVEMQENKAVTIATIRTQWEATHKLYSLGSSLSSPNLLTPDEEPFMMVQVNEEVTSPEQSLLSSASLPHVMQQTPPIYFLDLVGETLHLYSLGALDGVDVCGPMHSNQPVSHLHFYYIEFEDIMNSLPRLIRAYPGTKALSFSCTNLCGLEQLNGLAQMTSPLHALLITPYGNPITSHPLFTSYVLYRLSHLNLSLLNGDVVEEKVKEAEELFSELSKLATSQIPQHRLLSLILKYRPNLPKRLPPNSTSLKDFCMESTSRIGLHHFSTHSHPAQQERITSAQAFTYNLLSSVLLEHKKVTLLDSLWSRVMGHLVWDAMHEFGDMDTRMKSLFGEL